MQCIKGIENNLSDIGDKRNMSGSPKGLKHSFSSNNTKHRDWISLGMCAVN